MDRLYCAEPNYDALEILHEIMETGWSSGWAGTPAQHQKVKHILSLFGVRYYDDLHGMWTLSRACTNCGETCITPSRAVEDDGEIFCNEQCHRAWKSFQDQEGSP